MRLPRVTPPGVFHHVISRFVDRNWFFTDERERERYLHYLGRALDRSDWRCLTYALMSNHIHLGFIAGEAPLWSILKATNAPFARWMNKRHERLGPMFADRAAAWAIRQVNVAATIAYIHNNPVRAGVVSVASESTWTSHRAYRGLSVAPRWLDVETGRAVVGESAAFDEHTASYVGETGREVVRSFRAAAHRRGGIEVGTPTVAPVVVPLVARAFARIRPDPREIIDTVASVVGLPATRFAARSTSAECVRARVIAIRVARDLGVAASDMGSALGISRQAAGRALHRDLDAAAAATIVVVRARLTVVPPSPGKGALRKGLGRRRS